MAEELIGNVLVAQSGGPTSVINASLAGVISEALNYDCVEEIYGGLNGIEGILNEDLIDLAEESQQTIRALRYTPGSALGSCRYKIKKSQDLDRVLDVFEAHNIRYFFYIGGNDSQDTAHQIDELAKARGYALRVIGIPKTIDNDLPITDHCPGYGSVIKYIATTIREMGNDHAAMGNHDLVSIVEVMGRNAGWIAAGASLAKRRNQEMDPPHLIYLPEVPFVKEKFVEDVQNVLKQNPYCLVVVSEGTVDQDGNYLANASAMVDAFGHKQLGGAGEYLRSIVEEEIGVSAKSTKLGTTQRCAAHMSSQTDNNEAYLAGQNAVQAAMEGHSGMMITLLRGDTDLYTCDTSLTALEKIANEVKMVPKNWIHESGTSMAFQFYKYALPLVQGRVEVPEDQGLVKFARLDKHIVAKALDSFIMG
ncbi:MAG: 6-phosphofructokinase [Verrucomicrobia bacterium CG1_02_43_26]|nr:MAG: 6-phosphofructokinase [Verrucomicrobia bacterium CG1_02_43_26]